MAVLIKGHGADEGHLVFRSTPGGAAAEVGGVDLDIAAEDSSTLLLWLPALEAEHPLRVRPISS
jgi:hypothetical protein